MSFVNIYDFCVCPFPVRFEGGMWDLIVLIPDHCNSVYLKNLDPSKKMDSIRHLDFWVVSEGRNLLQSKKKKKVCKLLIEVYDQ